MFHWSTGACKWLFLIGALNWMPGIIPHWTIVLQCWPRQEEIGTTGRVKFLGCTTSTKTLVTYDMAPLFCPGPWAARVFKFATQSAQYHTCNWGSYVKVVNLEMPGSQTVTRKIHSMQVARRMRGIPYSLEQQSKLIHLSPRILNSRQAVTWAALLQFNVWRTARAQAGHTKSARTKYSSISSVVQWIYLF